MGISKMHHWLMGNGRLCSPAISPPICPPNPVPIPHASYNPSPSLLPSSSTHTSRFPTFPSPTPSSRILSLHSTPLPPSPNILPSILPPPSSLLSPSSTRPHLSLSLPCSHPMLPPPLLSPSLSSEVIGSYLINHFPPIPDLLPLSFQFQSISHSSLPLSILFPSSLRFLLIPLSSHSSSFALHLLLTPLPSSSPSSSRKKRPSRSFSPPHSA